MRRREECRDREGERRRFFFVLLDESGAGQARGEGRTGSRVEERQRGEREGEREGERRRWKRDRAKKREAGSDDDLAGREHEDPKRGQRENDKGERGGRFDWKGRQRGLFPFTSVFSVLRSVLSVVPARARARTPTHVHVHIHSAKYTYTHTYPRSLSFLSSPPLVPPRRPLVLSSFTLHAVLLLPLSSSFRAAFRPLRRRYCTYVCTRVYTCVRAPRLNRRRTRGFMSHGSARSRGERAALYVGERENVF